MIDDKMNDAVSSLESARIRLIDTSTRAKEYRRRETEFRELAERLERESAGAQKVFDQILSGLSKLMNGQVSEVSDPPNVCAGELVGRED